MRVRSIAVATAALAMALSGSAWAQLPAIQDRPLSAVERTRLASLEGQFARISRERNTSVAALRTIARAMGTRLTSQDPDQVLNAVDERAKELERSKDRITTLERELEALDSMKLAIAVGPLLNDARAAIEAGRLDEAEGKLEQAGERFAQARGSLQGKVDQLAGREADIFAQRAGVRSSVSDFVGAADLYARAAELAPASDPVARWRYLMSQAQALKDRGDLFGEPDRAIAAVEVLKTKALPLVPRAERPAEWAETQARLGVAQSLSAYARNDIPGMREGVASLRLTVEATPTDHADWLSRRIRLATSLLMLSERTQNPKELDESLALFRATAAARPENGPNFYRSYGAALGTYGIRLEGQGKNAEAMQAVKDSVEAFRKGIAQVDKERDVRMAGDLYNNLSFALKLMAGRESNAAYSRESVEAARQGLTLVDRERFPMLWATLKRRYGFGLVELNQFSPVVDDASLAEGIASLSAALEVVTRDKAQMLWAALQEDLAFGLYLQGMRRADAASLDPAIAAYKASSEVLTPEANPASWCSNQLGIAEILAEQARRSSGEARRNRYDAARATLAATEPVLRQVDSPPLNERLKKIRTNIDAQAQPA